MVTTKMPHVVVCTLLCIGLIGAPPAPAAASEDLFIGEEDLFGAGADLLVEVDPPAVGTSLERALLVNEGIAAGGSFRFALRPSWTWPDSGSEPAQPHTDIELTATVFMDARPDADRRVFAKAEIRAQDPSDPVRLQELFADFHHRDALYFRVGKQTVNWGVGYFFSPADVINVGRIDPEDPESGREGPIAFRVNQPRGSHNLYGYAVVDGGGQVAFAPKVEFVRGGTEWGLGLYHRYDRVPRGMVTLSTSLVGRLSLFAEAVVSYGSDKRFVDVVPPSGDHPFGVAAVERKDRWFAGATLGLRFGYADPDRRYRLRAAVQYYYNGEGHPRGLTDVNPQGIAALLQSGDLRPSDLRESGRHYAALSLTLTRPVDAPRLSPSVLWFGNLSDGSGRATLSLPFDIWEGLDTSVSLARSYGSQGSELAPLGAATSLTFNVAVGQRF